MAAQRRRPPGRDASGVPHATFPLAPDFTGAGYNPPSPAYDVARQQYDGGAMDGFRHSGNNDDFAIGYYVEQDRPFFNGLARHFTTLDHYFASILTQTQPNRLFANAAQTDRLTNDTMLATVPTIWDSLSLAGVSGAYYAQGTPFLRLWGSKYDSITLPYDEFLTDAAAGALPAVSFVQAQGSVTDDHPFADVRQGDAFLRDTVLAVMEGPCWPNAVITYDEWGGFFDHVAPPRADAPNDVDPDLVDGKALLGFRVPAVVVSPFSTGHPKHPRVNSLVYDHTSILKLIEWRWGLDPLTARDASDDINNLALALDL